MIRAFAIEHTRARLVCPLHVGRPFSRAQRHPSRAYHPKAKAKNEVYLDSSVLLLAQKSKNRVSQRFWVMLRSRPALFNASSCGDMRSRTVSTSRVQRKPLRNSILRFPHKGFARRPMRSTLCETRFCRLSTGTLARGRHRVIQAPRYTAACTWRPPVQARS